jgi:hypothetical protein
MTKVTFLSQNPVINTESTTSFYSLPRVDHDVIKLQVEKRTTSVGNNEPTITYNHSLWIDESTRKFYGRPTYVKPGFFEVDKKYSIFRDYYEAGCRVRPFDEFIVKLDSTDIDPSWELIFIDVSSHRLWTHDFKPIPTSISIHFDDKDIELNDSFLNYLRTHSWMVEMGEVEYHQYYDDEPYYNIWVDFLPDPESYQKIFEEAYPEGFKKKYVDINPFIYGKILYDKSATDWLGVRQFFNNPPK